MSKFSKTEPAEREILLVMPKYGRWDEMATRPPDSLLSIAAIPHSKGYPVTILDQRIDKNFHTKLLQSLERNPLCVGITSLIGEQTGNALEVSKIVKQHNPDIPVIWGGIAATLLSHQVIQNENVDLVVIGEGDQALLELCEAFRGERTLDNIQGIYFKQNGTVQKTPQREFLKDLDVLPHYPYELIDIHKYSAYNIRGKITTTIETSRGCPFRCKFCSNTVIARRRWRPRSAQYVLRWVKLLIDKYGVRDFFFQDDHIAVSRKRFLDILDGLIDLKEDIAWGTLGIRADTLYQYDDEILEKMYRSGCRGLDIGVESGSQRMLDFLSKDERLEEIFEVNRRLAKYPIYLKYTFMVGLPTETEEEVGMTVKAAVKLQDENPHAFTPTFLFGPLMGTDLWQVALDYGFKAPQRIEDWIYMDWDKWIDKYPSWVDKKRRRMLHVVNFTSYFANRNVKFKLKGKVLRSFFALYHPIAKFRFRKGFYHFFIEKKMEDIYFRLKGFLEGISKRQRH